MKESVRQGVTKVAGRLSSLANGMMSSLQVITLLSFFVVVVLFLFCFRNVMVTSREELFYFIFINMAHLQCRLWLLSEF